MKWSKQVVKHLETKVFFNNNKPLIRAGDRYIAEKVSRLKPGLKILDFGGGVGRFISVLKKLNGSVDMDNYFIYDSSSDMINAAKNRNPETSENYFSNKADLKKYDLVLCIDVLQHSYNLNRFINLIKEVRELGKVAVFHFWYKDDYYYQEIELHGEKFPELFPGIETIINELSKVEGSSFKLFPMEKPYKCSVMVIGDLEELLTQAEKEEPKPEPKKAPDPVKETEGLISDKEEQELKKAARNVAAAFMEKEEPSPAPDPNQGKNKKGKK